jgi:hypothetical protein
MGAALGQGRSASHSSSLGERARLAARCSVVIVRVLVISHITRACSMLVAWQILLGNLLCWRRRTRMHRRSVLVLMMNTQVRLSAERAMQQRLVWGYLK